MYQKILIVYQIHDKLMALRIDKTHLIKISKLK